MSANDTLSVAVLGASGYTGLELVRLARGHDGLRLSALTGDRHAGKHLAEIYPQLSGVDLPKLTKIEDVDWSGIDAVFCCLPHATTQSVLRDLPSHLKIVDLSADFRLADPAVYAAWYGHEHQAVELQKTAVYGLTEIAREDVRKARLVANPGCYPTTAQLPLVPLLEAGLIDPSDITIDAKSGVTGAGRSMREDLLFTELQDGIHAYGVGRHRHTPEIEQGLSRATGSDVRIAFTPHLMPMNRGILATIYVRLAGGATVDGLRDQLATRYAGEPFVHVMEKGQLPSTRYVRGTNRCMIGVAADPRDGRAIAISTIDNLVKGASGQALQNLNAMLSWSETRGLDALAFYP